MRSLPLSQVQDAIAPLPPELSAERVLSRLQIACLLPALAILAYSLAFAASTTLIVLLVCSSGFCLLLSVHQLIVTVIGLHTSPVPVLDALIPESELPIYTILVPIYREATVIRGLVSALERLDYPKHLLDLKLLVEADDSETLDALRSVPLGPQFELLMVPAGGPRTKPRACNFGLRHARGELVVIFDAEDRPEPDQLNKAVAAFRAASPEVACFQARLDFWNPATNMLTRYATARFCASFGAARLGLERISAPTPLGGTSNHFPVRVLCELGGWDPFNVAEDADLGMRLVRAGYRTRLLDSTTYEEANSQLGNWIRQQSRWIKGYIQTWLVHARDPVRLLRETGVSAAAHLQLTLLAAIIPTLLAPLRWMATLAWALVTMGVLGPFLPGWALETCAGSLLFGIAASSWIYATALQRHGYRDLVRFCVLFPGCELVRSIAAAKAVAQLLTRPSHWEKTVHGLVSQHGASFAYDTESPAFTD